MINSPPTTRCLIAVALMVKNEAVAIQATLYSMFKAGIRDYFILDTGSTDNTIDIIHAFFKRHQVNGYVKQEPFIDFATSRNRTLELAEEYFSHIPFMLMPDAEWSLRNGKALMALCQQEINSQDALYTITIKIHSTEFRTSRLFRTANCIRFTGVVHEIPDPSLTRVKIPSFIYFQADPTQIGFHKSKQRWQQDLHLLLNAYQNNPLDARNTFYLAQTYESLGDFDHAYHYYQRRAELTGWDEETFITFLRLGHLARKNSLINESSKWPTARDYFLKAYALRSHRIEPLIEIANYYWPDNIPACYLFAKAAYHQPYPSNEMHTVDNEIYQYTRYEIMSRCAWHVGEFALGEEATLLALKAKPGTPHLLNNLNLYRNANNKIS